MIAARIRSIGRRILLGNHGRGELVTSGRRIHSNVHDVVMADPTCVGAVVTANEAGDLEVGYLEWFSKSHSLSLYR